VSKVTVFNYFPRKEQLLFDRSDEAIELLSGAVRGRDADTSIPSALRRLMLDLAEQRHPLSGLRDGIEVFYGVVMASPALRAAAREAVDHIEACIAALIDEDMELPPGNLESGLLAAHVVASWRIVYLYAARRLLAGESAADIHPGYIAALNRGFDMIGE
jgi:AcrR family transcriptional regulator